MIGRCLCLRPEGANWAAAYRLANQLVRQGWAVLWLQQAATVGGERVPAGALLVPMAQPLQITEMDSGARQKIVSWARTAGLAVVEGEVGEIWAYEVPEVRIAIYGEAGSPFPHLTHLTTLGFHVEPVTAAQIRAGVLFAYDLLIVPGGGWDGMYGQMRPLGQEGAEQIAAFVKAGGGYLASCAGSYLACAVPSDEVSNIGAAQPAMRLVGARPINGCGTGPSGFRSPGIGVVRLRNTAPEHPVMFGVPAEFPCTHYNGPFFLLDAEAVPGAPLPQILAQVTGTTADFTYGEEFGSGNTGRQPTSNGSDGLGSEGRLMDQAIGANAASIVAGHYGHGAVVLAGSHPEFGLDALAMAEMTGAARILANAVWWLAVQGRPGPLYLPAQAAAPAVEQALTRAQALAMRLADEGEAAPAAQGARPQFGRPVEQVWRETLEQIRSRLTHMQSRWPELAARAAAIAELAPSGATAAHVRQEWLSCWAEIGYRRPGGWQQDFGYRGFLALLAHADEQMAGALKALRQPGATYSTFDLVARSYLSALGTVVAAEGTLERVVARLEQLYDRSAGTIPAARPATSRQATGT